MCVNVSTRAQIESIDRHLLQIHENHQYKLEPTRTRTLGDKLQSTASRAWVSVTIRDESPLQSWSWFLGIAHSAFFWQSGPIIHSPYTKVTLQGACLYIITLILQARFGKGTADVFLFTIWQKLVGTPGKLEFCFRQISSFPGVKFRNFVQLVRCQFRLVALDSDVQFAISFSSPSAELT